jgi:hypothetical protein
MTAINIKAFRGQVPRTSDRLLKANSAVRAVNCKLTSGRIDPLLGLGLELTTSVAVIKSMFRYRYFKDGIPVDNWFVWGSDVDAVLSPLSNDEVGRVYFTSEDFEPRMTTYLDSVPGFGDYPSTWFALGVYAPTVAPTVTEDGGSGTQEARGYVYTFVSRFGEESGPSPISTIVNGYINSTWTVSGMQVAPANSGAITAAQANFPLVGQVRITLNSVFGLEQFDTITISGVDGMTDINGSHRILSVDSENNRVVIAKLTSQTYTSGGTWTKNAPHNTAGMTKRIYRTAGPVTDLLFVAEIPVATTSYVDAKPAIDLGESIPSIGTLTPPKNLTCLISLPNGSLAGIAGNELCFSDPYKPHSWPDANRYSFSGRGVALSPAGNSVVVLTDSSPILFTGSDPSGMSPSTMETYAPCVSKRGVAFVGGGCLYPSYDGLWLAMPGRVSCVTRNLYRIEEWSKLSPSTFIASFRDGQYYAQYETITNREILVLDINEPDGVVIVGEGADGMYFNEYDGRLYLSQKNRIMAWDANEGFRYESEWLSPESQLGAPTNFSVAQIHAKFAEEVPIDFAQIAVNEALIQSGNFGGSINDDEMLVNQVNGSGVVSVIPDQSKRVQFTLYADGKPVFTREVTSSRPFRLPSGFRTEAVSIGLNAFVPTYSVTIAESTAELARFSV